MPIISKEAMRSVMSLRDKIADPEKRAECIAEVEGMIEMKESHLARAEWGSCCGSTCNLAPQIEHEIQMLTSVLELLKAGSTQASSALERYIALLQEGYRPEPDNW